MSWSEITVIKTGNIIVFQVVIWPVQPNPVNENLPHNEASEKNGDANQVDRDVSEVTEG